MTYTILASGTASSISTLDLTGIPSGHGSLRLLIKARLSNPGYNLGIKINNVGSTYNTNLWGFYGNNTFTGGRQISNTYIHLYSGDNAGTNRSNYVITFPQYELASASRNCIFNGGSPRDNTQGGAFQGTGVLLNSSAITSLQVAAGTGNTWAANTIVDITYILIGMGG